MFFLLGFGMNCSHRVILGNPLDKHTITLTITMENAKKDNFIS